jgi:hypothetical protein
MLDPGGAVLVEGGDARFGPHKVGARRVCRRFDEADDGGFGRAIVS